MHRSFWQSGALGEYSNHDEWKAIVRAKEEERMGAKEVAHPKPPDFKSVGDRKLEEWERHKKGFGATSTEDYFVAQGGYDPLGGVYRDVHVYKPNVASKTPRSTSVPNPLTLGFEPDTSRKGIRITATNTTYDPVLQEYRSPRGGLEASAMKTSRAKREMKERMCDYLPSGRIFNRDNAEGRSGDGDMAKDAIRGSLSADPRQFPNEYQQRMAAKRNQASDAVDFAMNADLPAYTEKNKVAEMERMATTRTRGREKVNTITQECYDEMERLQLTEREAFERREAVKQAKQRQLEMESTYNVISIRDKVTGESVDADRSEHYGDDFARASKNYSKRMQPPSPKKQRQKREAEEEKPDWLRRTPR